MKTIVITSLGARTDVNDAVHSWGGIVLHDIINDTFAHKAIEKGADGLIAVATGAGGHAGVKNPIALIHEKLGEVTKATAELEKLLAQTQPSKEELVRRNQRGGAVNQ